VFVDFDECVRRVAGQLTGTFDVRRERLPDLEMFSGLLSAVQYVDLVRVPKVAAGDERDRAL